MEYNIVAMQEKMKETLTKKRFQHTLGVQYTSASLAMKYGYNVQKASVAGLLHDNAKCLSDDKILELCRQYQLPISIVEEKNPYLLHAKLGAYYAKTQYLVEEDEILSAITYHTTGRPAMKLLDKIVFVADYIEPHRKQLDQLDEIRKIAFSDLDLAVYMILDQTLSYLKEDKKGNSRDIDGITIETFEFYKRKRIE